MAQLDEVSLEKYGIGGGSYMNTVDKHLSSIKTGRPISCRTE
jgi:glycerate-2-kinase